MMYVVHDLPPRECILTLVLAPTGATLSSRLRPPSLASRKSMQVGGAFYSCTHFVGHPIADNCCVGSLSRTANLQLGVIPGAGGTQRLTHAIGKSRAMELVLTGGNFSAQQASEWGLVSRVVDGEASAVVDEAVKVAGKIAGKGMLAVQAGKEGVNAGAFAFSSLSHAC